MGFVQRSPNGKRPLVHRAGLRLRGDALGALTVSEINSLISRLTPPPSPTTTTPSVYTTPTSSPTLVAPAPIAPPTTPPIVYSTPTTPPPTSTFTPPPPNIETFAPPPPPSSSSSSPTPPPSTPTSGGTSSGGGGATTLFPSSPSVDLAPPSSGSLPEVYNQDGSPATPAAATATFADKIAALPAGVKVGAVLVAAYLLFKGK